MTRLGVVGLEVKRPQAAAVLGLSVRVLAQLEAEGVLAPKVRGVGGRPSVYDLAALVPAYVAYVRAQAGRGTGLAGDARARRDRSTAELNELKLLERRRELLPRDQVVAEGQAFVAALRARLRALPRRLAQGGLVAPAQEAAVTALVRDLCTEVSTWSTVRDLQRAARRRS